MRKWELARHLIDAKKKIDTLCFIKDFQNRLCNFNLRERTAWTCQQFYIECCVILDKCFPKGKKKIISDPVIERIYYERDKNAAHKDESYRQQKFNTPDELISIMKIQIEKVKDLCSDFLPSVLTLDYVSHDKELFRYAYRITPDIERDIFKVKYPQGTFHSYQLSQEGQHYLRRFSTEDQDRRTAKMFGYDYDKVITKSILDHVDDVRELSEEEKARQAVMIENGLNSKEGLQNRQDACIKINVLFNQNMWATLNKKSLEFVERLQALGFLDEFELPNWDSMKNEETRLKILAVMEEENDQT